MQVTETELVCVCVLRCVRECGRTEVCARDRDSVSVCVCLFASCTCLSVCLSDSLSVSMTICQ